MMTDELKIHSESSGNSLLMRLSGSLDVATSPSLKDALAKALHEQGSNVVVDLTQVEFLDSTGLGALMGAHRRALENGGRLALIVHEGPISRLLTITGLSRVFSVYPSVGEALAGISTIE